MHRAELSQHQIRAPGAGARLLQGASVGRVSGRLDRSPSCGGRDQERFRMTPVFDAQVLTYLRLTDKHVGLLINFNTRLLKHGLRRLVL